MINSNDFNAEPLALKHAMITAVSRVFESGRYILGDEVIRFEKAWAMRCGCDYGVGVANGMDAIEIGLRAMGIGAGDEVITTSMTAFATVLAIIRCGATPVLADIRTDTAQLDMDSVGRCITRNTRALLLVHLYGQVSDLDAWDYFCKIHNIELLEDCAQAHLAKWNDKVAGSVGRFAAFSFYPTKNLGAVGDGGMLVTKDAAIASRAVSLRNYGQVTRYHHPIIGMNSRLDEIQAAILFERLNFLEDFTRRRIGVAELYLSGIVNPLVRPLARPKLKEAHVYHLFVVTTPWRDSLRAHLAASGVQAEVHYPVPIHCQEPCRSLQRDPAGLAACEEHATQCLSLPCHPFISTEDVRSVINAVNSFSPT